MVGQAALAWLVACAAPAGGPVRAPQREAAAAPVDCTRIPVSEEPWLFGLEASERDALTRVMKGGPALASYTTEGCTVRLRVLGDCRAQAPFTYAAGGRRERQLLRGPSELLERWPVAERSAAAALARHGALRADIWSVGRLEAPPGLDLGAVAERAECSSATHLIQRIELGGALALAGTAKALGGETSLFNQDGPRPGGVELLEKFGDPASCAKAEAKKERTAGCASPLRLKLVPLARPAETPATGLVNIPAGDFWMGAEGDKLNPRRRLSLEAFTIDRREVSAEDYAACVAAGACKPARTGGACTAGAPGKERHPINCVSFTQARSYCAWKEQRLPTEAEWERAARGTDGRSHPWGEAWPPEGKLGNFADESARREVPYWRALPGYDDGAAMTAPVGSYPAGAAPEGALDMAGNVLEWTADWFTPTLSREPVKNPRGPARGEARVVRGGSFGEWQQSAFRAARRAAYREEITSEHLGFRCAR